MSKDYLDKWEERAKKNTEIMELSKLVEEILKITNESPYGYLDMDSAEAGEIWKLLNKEMKQG